VTYGVDSKLIVELEIGKAAIPLAGHCL